MRGIDEDHHVHFFFVAIQLQVRTLNAGEDVPVDVTDIVPRRVIAVVVKLGAGSPFASEMFSSAPIGQPTTGQYSQSLDPRQRRVIEQRCKRSRRHVESPSIRETVHGNR